MKTKFHDEQYLELVTDVLLNGHQKGDRTGTGTVSTFGRQMRFDLSDQSIPLLTTKKMHAHSIIHELLWFLAGDTNIKYLNDNGVRIWNEWADENGELGPVYGKQWRKWKGPADRSIGDDGYYASTENEIDQIADAIDKLRNNPNDRRIIVSAWNVGEVDQMALPPCHLLYQFWSRELSIDERLNQTFGIEGFDGAHEELDTLNIPRRALSCQMYQRSCDVALGVPFNVAQYSILVHMIAQVTNHVAEEFIWTGGDVHIYNNHFDGLKQQTHRIPFQSPRILLNPHVKEIDDFRFGDIEIIDYDSHPTIKMSVSV